MKFILQEDKFILAENIKFLLEERFILTEATALELAQKWTTQLVKTFDNVEASLKKYIEYADISKAKSKTQRRNTELAAKVKEATDDFEILLRQPASEINANITDIKEILKKCTTALEEIEPTVEATSENQTALLSLKKIINSLNSLYNLTSWSDTHIKKLKQLVEQFTTLVKTILDTSAIKAESTEIQKFKENCEKALELLNSLKNKLPTDFTSFEEADLVEYQENVKQALDVTNLKSATTLNKGLVIASFTRYQQQVEAIISKYTQLLESTIFTLQTDEEEKKARAGEMSVTSDQKDWKSKLAGAVNKDNVIKEFIYTTWKTKADAVLKIKEPLLAECESYGFGIEGDTKNPFIQFISDVYLKYINSFTPEKYNIIHNLVANGRLTGKDLSGDGDMGKGNLVFCKALYELDAKVIKLYLTKQYNLLRAAKKPDTFNYNSEMAFNILYNLTEVMTGEQTKDSTDKPLRAMTDIEQLEAKWTGQISDTAESETGKKKIANNAELIRQINTTENAIKVLAAIAIKFSSNDKIVAATQSCKEAKELMSKTTTLEDIQKLVASVERLYKIESINATQALSLIKSILESDQFTLTME